MRIRRYLEIDWPRLCTIHDLARTDELRRSNLVDAFLPLEIATERGGLFGYEMLVAERDEMVLGFVAYSPEELAWRCIDPCSSRNGIGGRLARSAHAQPLARFACWRTRNESPQRPEPGMMKKILIGMATMSILGAIASAGYQTGKFLAQRDQPVQTPEKG